VGGLSNVRLGKHPTKFPGIPNTDWLNYICDNNNNDNDNDNDNDTDDDTGNDTDNGNDNHIDNDNDIDIDNDNDSDNDIRGFNLFSHGLQTFVNELNSHSSQGC